VTITEALQQEKGHVTRTALRLRVSRPFLWYYLRKLSMNDVPASIRRTVREKFTLPPLDKVTAP
jgi:hypothetical protein